MGARDKRWTAGRSAVSGATAKFRPSQLRTLRKCQQVAAVCYRIGSQGIEFLLVQTRGGRWTFPKGGVEPGLSHAQAAALEAFEEAGVHGRIEESSFAQYIRRQRGAKRNSNKAGLRIHAHLCEVLRLGPPQESNRHRTWFSAEKAKRRLCEDRIPEEGSEFTRVLDCAVEHIEQLHRRSREEENSTVLARNQQQLISPNRSLPQKDALQRVQFEAAEISAISGQMVEAAFLQYVRRQRADMRPSQTQAAENDVAVNAYLFSVSQQSVSQKQRKVWQGTTQPATTNHALNSAPHRARIIPIDRPRQSAMRKKSPFRPKGTATSNS